MSDNNNITESQSESEPKPPLRYTGRRIFAVLLILIPWATSLFLLFTDWRSHSAVLLSHAREPESFWESVFSFFTPFNWWHFSLLLAPVIGGLPLLLRPRSVALLVLALICTIIVMHSLMVPLAIIITMICY